MILSLVFNFREWYLRAETFIKWFIDGATYIDTDDEQWDYFTVFERFTNENQQTQYALAGFSTVFRFYCYPEMIRPRISQILIMPPFQKQVQRIYSKDHKLITVNFRVLVVSYLSIYTHSINGKRFSKLQWRTPRLIANESETLSIAETA